MHQPSSEHFFSLIDTWACDWSSLWTSCAVEHMFAIVLVNIVSAVVFQNKEIRYLRSFPFVTHRNQSGSQDKIEGLNESHSFRLQIYRSRISECWRFSLISDLPFLIEGFFVFYSMLSVSILQLSCWLCVFSLFYWPHFSSILLSWCRIDCVSSLFCIFFISFFS